MIKFIEDKELCIKLKEKGFDEGCILQFRGEDTQPVCQMSYELNYEKNSDYNTEDDYWLSCPTYCQVSDWLRDKYNVHISVFPIIISTANKSGNRFSFTVDDLNNDDDSVDESPLGYLTYYEAFTEAIEEALELI
jgi:hypothetical protein